MLSIVIDVWVKEYVEIDRLDQAERQVVSTLVPVSTSRFIRLCFINVMANRLYANRSSWPSSSHLAGVSRCLTDTTGPYDITTSESSGLPCWFRQIINFGAWSGGWPAGAPAMTALCFLFTGWLDFP
jgi:hypothetical protein